MISQLDELETKDPKTYWKLVNSLKDESDSESPEKSIDSNTWHDYFVNLNSVEDKFKDRCDILDKKLETSNEVTFNLLDSTIKEKEIQDNISKLHNNKATGLDTIKNEMLKHGITEFIPCLRKLFNLVLSSGIYPSSWATGYISPIFKTGDSSQPENYRGITITSNVGKLFNLILNSRLDKFLDENKLINKSQIGFTKNARTQDHMFVLKTLIDKYTHKSGDKLYACFVDFKKAFDSVIHPGLKLKLKELNISGKFYDVIKNMYSKSKLCVKLGDTHTKFFTSGKGVRQGDVLSPNLFKIFINDFPNYLSECKDPVNINNNVLQCLMYADDIVLFSTSLEGLQQRLNGLDQFCKEWCLDLNVSKTKILIFNKGGKLIKNTLYFDKDCLECVQHYRYLGVYFSASGIFNYGQQDIFNKARKASFKLTKLVSSAEPSIKTSLHLYDHLIKPILLYGSEIWGIFKTNSKACKNDESFKFSNIYKNSMVDKSQISFLKYILGVNRFSSNLAVLSETGRLPIYFSVIMSVVKYLHRLENASDGLLKDAYISSKRMHQGGLQSWYTSAIYILQLLGLKISSCLNLTINQLTNIVKNKLIKQYSSYWNQERSKHLLSGKLDTYFNLKQSFCFEPYLSLTNFHHRRAISKIRISAHNLMIESGRYKKPKPLPREDRLCKFCNLNEVENEIHFITRCLKYDSEREEFYKTIRKLNANFDLLNDLQKTMWLLSQECESVLIELACFILKCFDKRTTIVH